MDVKQLHMNPSDSEQQVHCPGLLSILSRDPAHSESYKKACKVEGSLQASHSEFLTLAYEADWKEIHLQLLQSLSQSLNQS